MRLFLLSFFLIYGLMHGYAFLKARAALQFGSGPGILLGLFMLFMILAPHQEKHSEYLPLLGKLVEVTRDANVRKRLLKIDEFTEIADALEKGKAK